MIIEVTVRCFFTAIFFILMALIEQNLDFYQFRWISILACNQILMLCSVVVNPVHSLIAVAVVTKPLLDILKIKDLRKIDPLVKLSRRD